MKVRGREDRETKEWDRGRERRERETGEGEMRCWRKEGREIGEDGRREEERGGDGRGTERIER